MSKGSCLQIITALSLSLLGPISAWADRFEFVSDRSLSSIDENFGGFSGLELSQDGSSLIAISDRGFVMQASIERDGDHISQIKISKIAPVLQINGNPVTPANFDAEGLATAADGTSYISFEGFHRVRQYPDILGPAQNLPAHSDFASQQTNSSLEVLAIDAQNRLYTAPERSGKLERPFPLWRFEDGAWQRFGTIPRLGEYLLVGADIGPDGKFYLLERGFRGITFSARIRRFSIGARGLIAGETLLVTDYGTHDNLEGLSIWQDSAGAIRATMISDDNFRFFQTTELGEYVLKSDAP